MAFRLQHLRPVSGTPGVFRPLESETQVLVQEAPHPRPSRATLGSRQDCLSHPAPRQGGLGSPES